MISDPLSIENGATDLVAPRIISTSPNSGRFRYEGSGGENSTFEFIQNGNASRSRHVARFVVVNAPDLQGVQHSCTFTLTVDEPASGAISNADLLYIWNTQFKGTLTDTVFTKLMNGEV